MAPLVELCPGCAEKYLSSTIPLVSGYGEPGLQLDLERVRAVPKRSGSVMVPCMGPAKVPDRKENGPALSSGPSLWGLPSPTGRQVEGVSTVDCQGSLSLDQRNLWTWQD